MTYRPQKILTTNGKTGVSIDLPIKGHCKPTKICSKDCYARSGHQAMKVCTRKQKWVSDYLRGDDISELVQEARLFAAVRLNGCGDLLPEHINNLFKLAEACPFTQFWGMTRKKDIAMAVNGMNGFPDQPNLRILLSVDASSPESVWKYPGPLCFGPRRPEDQVPDDPRIKVVFPRHFAGKVIKDIPEHPLDCQGVYHRISGCMECGRCWMWKKPVSQYQKNQDHSLDRLKNSLEKAEKAKQAA